MLKQLERTASIGVVMKIDNTDIQGLYYITPNVFRDRRGVFIKSFNSDIFQDNGINIDIKEVYYSISSKNVIRGMHFQSPPHAHSKLVYVPRGAMIDVVLDIRADSPTYGKYLTFEVNEENNAVILIPEGCIHGLLSLRDDSLLLFHQSSNYAPEHDKGIEYNSFGFSWPDDNPIISDRNIALSDFSDYTPVLF